MERYEPLKIEQKWQKIWEESEAFKAGDDETKPKMYLAEMFPYPSGAGLHVGHVRNFTINFKTTDAANAFAQIANQYQDIIEAYSNCDKGYAVEGDAHYCCGRI
mgnify:CR=1 FL=1